MSKRVLSILIAVAVLALVTVLWQRARGAPEPLAPRAHADAPAGEHEAAGAERRVALEAGAAAPEGSRAGAAPAASTGSAASSPPDTRVPARAGLAGATIGESAVVPAGVQPVSPEERLELDSKYAGSTPAELRAQLEELGKILAAHRASIERGDAAGRLDAEGLRRLQLEIGWLKTRIGS